MPEPTDAGLAQLGHPGQLQLEQQGEPPTQGHQLRLLQHGPRQRELCDHQAELWFQLHHHAELLVL